MGSMSTPLSFTGATFSSVTHNKNNNNTKLPFHSFPSKYGKRPLRKLHVSSPGKKDMATTEETIFYDGGAHYGDLVANLVLGLTLFWLPLTVAAVSRAFNLRYRFSNLRVTVISGLTGEDRSDFSYKVIKDVKVVPRFIGEWGDIIITLKDGTVIDLRSVPKFREIANYSLAMSTNST
ncbi:uncharacterized protein [Euphorbia lathyris]|uniref:uncharacterized protein n=1 Tax=Euphorbia lathyris TaxID=212925 RepID=UPI0033143900